MIIDHVKNTALYEGVHPRIAKALRYLREHDFLALQPGKYEVEAESIYYFVQHYDTKPQAAGLWEAHRQYFDIQFVAEGRELLGYSPIERMEETRSYTEDGDYALFAGKGSFHELQAGHFAILAPQDVHMPCICVADAQPVKKIVFKVLIQ